jgi:ubiquitin-protein ligase
MSAGLAPSLWQQLVRDYDELELSSGLYVFPDICDPLVWHVCFFVHSGPYCGIYRAVLSVHPTYPAAGARPVLTFIEKPFHPLVHPGVRMAALCFA